jgi:cytochrome c oxidase subunit II
VTDSNNNKKSLKSFFWLWGILTVILVVMGLFVPGHFMPRSMSGSMHLTILTMVVFTVAAAPVAAGVYAAAIYILRNWVHKGDDVPPPAEPIRDSGVVVATWVSVSVLLTLFLLIWGLGALAEDNSTSSSDPLVVNVIGQQWVWTFQYPGTHVESNSLYLPEGREVEFHVTSLDVTHGFWIVQMGVQVDANPGVITTIHTTPNQLGTFNVRCEQFCGLNHAFMDALGHVVSPQQFNTWLAAQPQRAQEGTA